jgi:thiamine biosynthesis lipoprotein
MGTNAHVLAVGHDAERIVDAACDRLEQLEARWSRFREESEISRLNAYPGRPVVVSHDTLILVMHAVEGWRRTAGRFDPTGLAAVCAAGYDADFAAVRSRTRFVPEPAAPTRGAAAIICDAFVGAVTIPVGVAFDPGGIGKGLAADVVTSEMLAAGASGALVNVGGDLRVQGEPPNGTAWDIAVLDPARDDLEFLRVALHDGAVATSSRLRRAWSTTAGPMHHLIDPSTGSPTRGRFATVTAVTGEAWWAEVVAKAVIVGDLRPAEREELDAHVATIDDDGAVECDADLAGARP